MQYFINSFCVLRGSNSIKMQSYKYLALKVVSEFER